ncbi:hypothetical protein GH714_024418 [Hevea brasiliensis]|uniref:Ubiquitin-like modifier-activating enzyme 5 n=1 Tax=Hevea brasiliensis TaxID=3981 RepID=A0A6A6ME33_HEVBR|nr:hypothetical protein GH714_024418 [Hevea brasiliensis]
MQGIGGVAAEMLTRCGIGRLLLYDYDKVGMTKTDAAVQTLSDINPDVVLESYTLNITTVHGFETFISSLKNKSFHPTEEGSGVDLVLSCVDNYEARMAVNQACNELNQTWMESDAVSGHRRLLIPGETACFACAPPLVVASGVDERTLKRRGFVQHLCLPQCTKYTEALAQFGHVSPYLQGCNSLKDYFPTMEMRPNPQCSHAVCLERQKEYLLAKPARDAAAKTKMEAESFLATGIPLHADNEWNIRRVTAADTTTTTIDDLEELTKQLDALNA